MRLRTALLLLAFLAGPAFAQADPALVTKLRQGGYVLFLRHTSTDFSQNDAQMRSFEDCASQRNLTDKGRDEARALGAEIKRLGIPIGLVHASPFCRTQETARLAFGRADRSSVARGGPANTNVQTRYSPQPTLLHTNQPSALNAEID